MNPFTKQCTFKLEGTSTLRFYIGWKIPRDAPGTLYRAICNQSDKINTVIMTLLHYSPVAQNRHLVRYKCVHIYSEPMEHPSIRLWTNASFWPWQGHFCSCVGYFVSRSFQCQASHWYMVLSWSFHVAVSSEEIPGDGEIWDFTRIYTIPQRCIDRQETSFMSVYLQTLWFTWEMRFPFWAFLYTSIHF
jgi:hypothetical protein